MVPCAQVEATKFTEVGFHGRDVDQIIKDLVEVRPGRRFAGAAFVSVARVSTLSAHR